MTTTSRQIFETVIKEENLVENFFLGLCALIGGDFVFLPPDLKIHKVSGQLDIHPANKRRNFLFCYCCFCHFLLHCLCSLFRLRHKYGEVYQNVRILVKI